MTPADITCALLMDPRVSSLEYRLRQDELTMHVADFGPVRIHLLPVCQNVSDNRADDEAFALGWVRGLLTALQIAGCGTQMVPIETDDYEMVRYSEPLDAIEAEVVMDGQKALPA